MRFVDQVRIFVKAGDGGNGAVAFRREKFVEKGGPSGGDGGNGGSVVFVADPQLTTLLDYRYQQHHRARHGEHGMGSDCYGRAADDLVLRVPVGTLIRDVNADELLCDMDTPGQRYVAAQGGKGGRGNMHFATSTRQTPRFAEDGTPGEERTLVLELKLLADVGLLGFPNAGKSTLIARVSRARPKIADYPFTTLAPNLGVVAYKNDLSFVIADIPGLIEGASEGAGLGHRFLRHVERCRVLIHLVDLSNEAEGRDPVKDFDTLNEELAKYSATLADKPQVVAANKLDLPHAREALGAFEKAMKKRGHVVYPLSGVTGEGVPALLDAVAQVLFAKPSTRGPVKARHAEKAQASAAPAAKAGNGAARTTAKPAKKAAAAAKTSQRGTAKSKKYARAKVRAAAAAVKAKKKASRRTR